MRTPAGYPIEVRRRVIAFALVALLVVPPIVFAMADGLAGGAGGSQSSEPAAPSTSSYSESDALEMLHSFEKRLDEVGTEVPVAFANEIGVLPACRDVRVSDDGSVVGYLAEGSEAEVMAQVAGRFGELGWQCVPLGSVTGATFVKSDGALRWALVTCTQVGDATSVVVRCPQEELA